MVKMPDNWKVEFQNAAGQNVFIAGGHESVMTTDIKTPETFLFKGLVKMEEQDAATQDFGCDVEPVSETWKKAVINAQDFGIVDQEITLESVDPAVLTSAREQADINLQTPPAPHFM